MYLEGSYAETKIALLSLYKSFNRYFGLIFKYLLVFWMDKFLYRNKLGPLSPKTLAPNINVPVLLIHGEKDMTFPVKFAQTLAQSFPNNQTKLWIAKGAGHSDSSFQTGYKTEIKKFLNENFEKA